jgi:hypothetical protein
MKKMLDFRKVPEELISAASRSSNNEILELSSDFSALNFSCSEAICEFNSSFSTFAFSDIPTAVFSRIRDFSSV